MMFPVQIFRLILPQILRDRKVKAKAEKTPDIAQALCGKACAAF
jgi:hypothetical protein